MMKGGNYAVLI